MSGTMKVYRLTIEPLTSFRTPLQSDTIFGHLMWALRYTEGEADLEAFLARYRDAHPPLLVSAGFPSGTLPVPVLPPALEEERGLSVADEVVGSMLRKALEDQAYLPIPEWGELAKALSPEALRNMRDEILLGKRPELQARLRILRETQAAHPVTRTAVDRVTGSAREGRLFVSMETFYSPGRTFDIWHKLDQAEDGLLKRLNAWWRWIERNGFGRRKSAGHGAFRIQGHGLVEADGELPHLQDANGFVTLSAWVPKKSDPTKVTYRTRVKRGKLAEALAVPSPWKKPLLMLEPGAVARLDPGKTVDEWYGRMVGEMHWVGESVPDAQRQAVNNVVQYGYAFPLPVNVEEGA